MHQRKNIRHEKTSAPSTRLLPTPGLEGQTRCSKCYLLEAQISTKLEASSRNIWTDTTFYFNKSKINSSRKKLRHSHTMQVRARRDGKQLTDNYRRSRRESQNLHARTRRLKPRHVRPSAGRNWHQVLKLPRRTDRYLYNNKTAFQRDLRTKISVTAPPATNTQSTKPPLQWCLQPRGEQLYGLCTDLQAHCSLK